MRFGSLFTGLGGMDRGLEASGMECVWQVENDEYRTRILERQWPHVTRRRDVRECGRHNLAPVDLICIGDPCQSNSNAQRNGSGAPSLGGEGVRVVDELRPRLVLRENPSVVKRDAPWPWHRFRGELERLGYAVLPFRLRACCAGADHRRERMFLLAALQDADQTGLEGDECEILAGADEGRPDADIARPDRWSAAPRICGRADGIPHRRERLEGLGDAVVPQVAQIIGGLIMRHHSLTTRI